ncbi:MAG: c-type cytochrome [Pseudomonadales bacterium]
MKNLMLLPFLVVTIVAVAGPIEDEIIARIHKVGDVCLVGQACAAGEMMEALSDTASSPESIYERSCSTCHDLGIAGAPKMADVAQWAPRLEKGMDTLYDSGIYGLAPGMPAKGMCFECSDDDIKAVVDYMVAASQ